MQLCIKGCKTNDHIVVNALQELLQNSLAQHLSSLSQVFTASENGANILCAMKDGSKTHMFHLKCAVPLSHYELPCKITTVC